MQELCSMSLYYNGEKARELHDLVESWIATDKAENQYGPSWLGNVALGAGLADEETVKTNPYKGKITYSSMSDEDQYNIDILSSQKPVLSMWKKIVDERNLDLEIIYFASQPENEILSTNDPVCQDTYQVETKLSENVSTQTDMEPDELENFLKNYLSGKNFNTESLDLQELIKRANDEKITVKKWDFIELEEAIEKYESA